MNDPKQIPPERNAVVHIEHRHQVRMQIYLPMIIGVLVVLAGVIAIIIYGVRAESTLRRWADVSVIWIIIPAMFIGVIFMIVVVGGLYAVTRVLGVVPGYSKIVQGYFGQVEGKVLQVTDAVVEPILRVRSSWAVVKRKDKLLSKQDREQ